MISRPNSDACVAGALPIGELTDTQLVRGVVKLRRRMDRADALFAEWTLAAHQRGACTSSPRTGVPRPRPTRHHPSLCRSAAYFKAHAQADGTAPVEPDGLHLTKVLDDRAKLTGEINGLAAETITTALNAFMDPPSEGDGRTDAQRRAGALVRISEIALNHGTSGTRAGANVTIIVDWKTLTLARPATSTASTAASSPAPTSTVSSVTRRSPA